MMVLVTGGAASGKSEYAERLVCSELPGTAEAPAAEGPRIYVAAMQPFGSEAEERIRNWRRLAAVTRMSEFIRFLCSDSHHYAMAGASSGGMTRGNLYRGGMG